MEQVNRRENMDGVRHALAALVEMHTDGENPVFRPELSGYAAQSAAKELLESWDQALMDDPAGKIVGNLIGDVDETIAALKVFRDRASAILPPQYLGKAGAEAQPEIRPATLFVEAFADHVAVCARWARIELTSTLVLRVQELRDLCQRHGWAHIREFGSPAEWSGAGQWRPDVPHLHVSAHDLWYEAVPKSIDTDVRTQAVPIDLMVQLLLQPQTGLHDSQTFKWIDGKLYCDGTDAEYLAETVAEYGS